MLRRGHFRTMDEIDSIEKLKRECRFQGSWFPVGEFVLVTRWGWNYSRDEMGFEGHIFRYCSEDRSDQAPIELLIASSEFYEDFTDASKVGDWAVEMISKV